MFSAGENELAAAKRFRLKEVRQFLVSGHSSPLFCRLYGTPKGTPLFTNNETNGPAAWGAAATSASPYTKDAFHRHVIHDAAGAVNPEEVDTKAAIHYRATVPASGSVVWRFRLTPAQLPAALDDVETIVEQRRSEADEFYAAIHPPKATQDERLVQRQALAESVFERQVRERTRGAIVGEQGDAVPRPFVHGNARLRAPLG